MDCCRAVGRIFSFSKTYFWRDLRRRDLHFYMHFFWEDNGTVRVYSAKKRMAWIFSNFSTSRLIQGSPRTLLTYHATSKWSFLNPKWQRFHMDVNFCMSRGGISKRWGDFFCNKGWKEVTSYVRTRGVIFPATWVLTIFTKNLWTIFSPFNLTSVCFNFPQYEFITSIIVYSFHQIGLSHELPHK